MCSTQNCHSSLRSIPRVVLSISVVLVSISLLSLVSPYIISSSASPPEEGTLWAGEKKKVIEISSKDGQHLLEIPAHHLKDIAVDNNRSAVWVGTKKEVIKYTLTGDEVFRYPIHDDHDDLLDEDSDKAGDDKDDDSDEKIVQISLFPADGSLCIGAKDAIIRLSSDGQKLFEIKGIKYVEDVSVDLSDNSCWVGLKHQAMKYASDGTPLIRFSLENGNEIRAIAAEPYSHSLYLGTKKGLIKVNKNGLEEFRIDKPHDIKDLKIDLTDASLLLVTKKEILRYSSSGEKLLYLAPCKDDNDDSDDSDDDHGSKDKNDDDSEKCEGNLITLAVDPLDGTGWIAWRKSLLKLTNTGETLLWLTGFKQIQALDIGLPKIGIKITEPLDGAVLNDPVLTVKGAVTDPLARVTVNGIEATITGAAFEAKGIHLSEGLNTVTATAVNIAGLSVSDTITVAYKQPLTIKIASPQHGATVSTSSISVTGTVSNSAAKVTVNGIEAVVSGNTFTAADVSLNLGINIITATASLSGFSVSNAISITFTPPPLIVEITSPVEGATFSTSRITVSGTVSDSSAKVLVNGTEAVVSGNAFTAANIPITIGGNSITAAAADPQGQAASDTLTVTYTWLKITIASPSGGDVVSTSSVDVTGTVSEPSAYVEVNGNEALVSTNGSFTVYHINLSKGMNQITAYAANQAGQTDEDMIEVTYEPPSVPLSASILSPNNGSTIESDYFTVTGVVSDPEATVLVNDTIATIDEDGFYSASVYACSQLSGSRTFARCDDCYFEGVLPFPFVLQGTTFTRYTTSSNGGIELIPDAGYFQLEENYGDATDMMWYYDDATMIFASFDDLSSDDYGSFGTRHIRPGYRDADGNVITEEAFMFYWKTETYADEGGEYLNYFEVLLYPDGRIKWNFNHMDFYDYGYQMYSGIYNGRTGLNLEAGRAIGSNRSFVMLPSAGQIEEIGSEWVASRGSVEWDCPVTVATYSKDGQTISAQTINHTYIPAQDPFTATITSPSHNTTVTYSPIEVKGVIHDVLSAVASTPVAVNGNEATVNGDVYTASVPLSEGINYITVHAINVVGIDAYDTIKVIYEPPTKPLAVQITSPLDKYIVNYSSIRVSGIISDSTAVVTINGTTAIKDFRSFKIDSLPLSIGENIITATATRPNGETAAASIKITYDPSYPSPSPPILSKLSEYTTTGYIEVSGLTIPSYKVETFVNGINKGVLTADSTGFFKASVWLPNEGPNHISARATDLYGNKSSLSSEAVITRDTISPNIQYIRAATLKWDLVASRVRITGKTEAQATVTIAIDNDPEYQYAVTAGADGKFSIDTHLSSGRHHVSVTAKDLAGNTAHYEDSGMPVHDIGNPSPAFPTIDPIPNPINEGAITIEGNAYAGFDVEIYRNNEIIGSARANSRGRFKLEGVTLMPGRNTIKAKQLAGTLTYHGYGHRDLSAGESMGMLVDVISGIPVRPEVKIDFPPHGAITDAEFLPLRGTVDTPDATLRLRSYYCNCYYTNGRATMQNGSFVSDTKIPLLPGENILWVEAEAPNGSRGVDKITVYSRKDAQSPSVQITSPVENQEVYDQYITASGTIGDTAQKVIVNNVEAAVNSGAFTAHGIDILNGYRSNPYGYDTILTAWAMDANGNIGHHDVPLRYRYIPTPQVSVSTPISGEIIASSPVAVTGTVYDATEVMVNGIAARIEGNQWTAQIEPQQGQYAITVIAKNQVKAAAKTITVTYEPGTTITLQSIAIEPATTIVPLGGTLQLSATGTYTNGQTIDLTQNAQWQSSNINIATVNNGFATGETSGSATITVSYGGLTASQTITVDQPKLKTIRIGYEWTTPDGRATYLTNAPHMETGDTLQFKAFGYYSDDSLYDLSRMYGQLTWTSSNQGVATINTRGLVTATGKGTTTITATHQYGGNTVTGSTTLTVNPSPVYIFITSPTDGSTINKSEVTISGTVITKAHEVGITVNGILASVYGNQFTANHVPLVEGTNTITAKAIDTNGAVAEAKVTIIAAQATNSITLTSNIESGIAPLEATLTIDGTINFTESTLTYAYTGTTPPEVTTISSEEYQVKMTAEGIYTFTANVTDAQGNTYTDTIAITVLNRDTLDALLKAKWEGMKTAMVSQDIEKAVSYVTEESKALYRELLTALYSNLPQIAQAMQDIRLIYVENNSAKYRIKKAELYGIIAYPIYFILDKDGIWKIHRY